MRELNVNEIEQVNGGIVFLIPPAVTIGVKVFGVAVGIIGTSISVFSAYRSLK